MVIFQPHRYTRTLNHYKEFAAALAQADEVYVTDIYSAGEESIEGVTADLIIKHLPAQVPTHHFSDNNELCQHFWEHHTTGEGVAMTIGAGDVYQVAQQIARGRKKS